MPEKHATRWCAPIAALLAALVVVSGCTLSSRLPDEKVVLTTFTVLADIASNVAGDRLRVESLTRPGAEIHGYEPSPGDVRRTATASLVVDNGLNLEGWFGRFVDDLDVEHVVASEGVEPIDITADAYAGKPNPHAWMSPVNVGIYVDNLVRAFTDLDPEGAEVFAANGAAYKEQLHQVQTHLVSALDRLPPNERALVTCEGAFSYLARDAGLTERYLWPVNAEQQATPQQVAEVIDFVKRNRVPAVFCESTVSDDAMQQVVAATGARFGGKLYVDSLSQADGPVPSYLDLIRHDVRTIVTGLTGDKR
ncbi:metal ABC transporter substrate-binding protein [Gordonia paraffinivorans]|uniref:metal ABC transporter substrate-binding protein n=1 Tax=Gordonia paraffinivorans TaxID=175628 RepID=UPI001444D0BA|nr:metal ABC transporter substrate-binding protein [Gordonia paraffinivorans]